MAVIEVSSTLSSTMINIMFNPLYNTVDTTTANASATFFPYAAIGTYPNNPTGIYIMKGTMPADFSTLTTFSARSADVLVGYNANTTIAGAGAYVNNKWVLSTANVLATASGTATWFWALGTLTTGTSASPIYQQFMGTVGTSGSGADLEINDTAVISGNPYRIVSLTVNVSPTYTV